MNKYRHTCQAFLALSLLLPTLALAGWQLDSNNALVSFVSIKNNTIAELHRFDELQGGIDASGKATVNISLASVNTGIEIRDQRLQELLFDTASFPQATISTQLDQQWLSALLPGQPRALDLDFVVAVHGKQQTISALVSLIIDARGNLHVESMQPILLDAAQFGLIEGIGKLQELAALQAIATAVPVTFAMVFKPIPAE